MEKIKEIIVNKKKYTISLIPLGIPTSKDKSMKWWCAYVILKGKKIKKSYNLMCCTYKEKNVYGIDTNHLHNMSMSYEEKYKDAIRQIKMLIKSYEDY